MTLDVSVADPGGRLKGMWASVYITWYRRARLITGPWKVEARPRGPVRGS